MRKPLIVSAAVLATIAGAFGIWRKGWVVAESSYIQVRKVPVRTGLLSLPMTTDYCYVIEVGSYPFESTFRVGWDSFEARQITITPPSREQPSLRVRFDDLHTVTGRFGGDVQAAEWQSQ